MVRQKCSQVGKARVDALHAAPLVGVGDLPPDPLLLLHGDTGLRAMIKRSRYVTWDEYSVLYRPSAVKK